MDLRNCVGNKSNHPHSEKTLQGLHKKLQSSEMTVSLESRQANKNKTAHLNKIHQINCKRLIWGKLFNNQNVPSHHSFYDRKQNEKIVFKNIVGLLQLKKDHYANQKRENNSKIITLLRVITMINILFVFFFSL